METTLSTQLVAALAIVVIQTTIDSLSRYSSPVLREYPDKCVVHVKKRRTTARRFIERKGLIYPNLFRYAEIRWQ